MAVRMCPGCGEANKENARICVVCSNSLKDVPLEGILNSEKRYKNSLIAKKTITHCSQCNEKVDENALKCKYCETLISRNHTTKSNKHSVGRSHDSSPDGCAVALLFVATFIIPLVGLIVGGIFSFSDDGDKQEMGIKLLVFGLVMIGLQIFLAVIFT